MFAQDTDLQIIIRQSTTGSVADLYFKKELEGRQDIN